MLTINGCDCKIQVIYYKKRWENESAEEREDDFYEGKVAWNNFTGCCSDGVIAGRIFLLYLKKIITNYSKNLLNSSIQNQANEIESWLNENLSAFQIVKQTIEGVNPDDNEMQGILNQYYGYDADYPEGLYIADENGKLMMAEGAAKSETNPTESVWYRDGLTRVNMRFIDSYVNSDGEAVISASGIINDGSDKLRVISADMTIQRQQRFTLMSIGSEQ